MLTTIESDDIMDRLLENKTLIFDYDFPHYESQNFDYDTQKSQEKNIIDTFNENIGSMYLSENINESGDSVLKMIFTIQSIGILKLNYVYINEYNYWNNIRSEMDASGLFDLLKFGNIPTLKIFKLQDSGKPIIDTANPTGIELTNFKAGRTKKRRSKRHQVRTKKRRITKRRRSKRSRK
jgi:hypothetical protein